MAHLMSDKPPASNTFRKIQLQTDIGLSGVFTLSLSGTGTFRVWQSENPGTNDIPNVDCAVNILVRRTTDRRPVSEL